MRAVVVGGGVAGLVAARELVLLGHDVELLEASDRFGGMIRGLELGGVVVDAGAEAFATRGGDVEALSAELGLEVALPAARSSVWWPDRGTFPLGAGPLGIPAGIDDPALAVLSDDERARVALDLTEPVGEVGVTVADLVAGRLGEAALRRLVAPLTQGVYRMTPEAMPVDRFAPGLAEETRRHGSLLRAVAARPAEPSVAQPVGGMHVLVAALVDWLRGAGAELHTGRPVVSLADLGVEPGAVKVVLATPAAVTANFLVPLGVMFTPPAISRADSLLLALATPALAADPLGSGVLLGERPETMAIRALTHYSAKWPWARRPGTEVLRVALADVGASLVRVLDDVGLILGTPVAAGDVIDHARVHWDGVPRVLAAQERGDLLGRLAGSGIGVAGAWLAGNGLAAVVSQAREVARCV